MDISTMPINNNNDNYIDIHNNSDFILRIRGVYYMGSTIEHFTSLNCFPGEHVNLLFAPTINIVEFEVDMWLIAEGRWISFAYKIKLFPGKYCFRASGSIVAPSFVEIPCPNNLNC